MTFIENWKRRTDWLWLFLILGGHEYGSSIAEKADKHTKTMIFSPKHGIFSLSFSQKMCQKSLYWKKTLLIYLLVYHSFINNSFKKMCQKWKKMKKDVFLRFYSINLRCQSIDNFCTREWEEEIKRWQFSRHTSTS